MPTISTEQKLENNSVGSDIIINDNTITIDTGENRGWSTEVVNAPGNVGIGQWINYPNPITTAPNSGGYGGGNPFYYDTSIKYTGAMVPPNQKTLGSYSMRIRKDTFNSLMIELALPGYTTDRIKITKDPRKSVLYIKLSKSGESDDDLIGEMYDFLENEILDESTVIELSMDYLKKYDFDTMSATLALGILSIGLTPKTFEIIQTLSPLSGDKGKQKVNIE